MRTPSVARAAARIRCRSEMPPGAARVAPFSVGEPTMPEIQAGALVKRTRGRTAQVGRVERIIRHSWTGGLLPKPKARVLWFNTFPRFHGGIQNTHGTIGLGAIRALEGDEWHEAEQKI